LTSSRRQLGARSGSGSKARSSVPGSPPTWLVQASAFDVLGFHEGSTVIELEEPALAEVGAGRFSQEDLFQPVDVELGALSLVQPSLTDALRGRTASELYDHSLLDRPEAYGQIFSRGIERIEFSDERTEGGPVCIERDQMITIRRLRLETPADQRVRVASGDISRRNAQPG
jgi:hypothetical protein